MKRKISIEALLVWAYRDQMVHAACREGEPVELRASGYSPGGAASKIADRIDSSTKIAFAAHADAYAVDRAVGRLGVVRRPLTVEERAVMVARRMISNSAGDRDRRIVGDFTIGGRVSAQGGVSGTIQASRAVYERGRETVEDDLGEIVHLDALVRMYAMKGERPFTIPEPIYAYESAGMVRDHRSHRPIYCRLRAIGDDPLEVEKLRACYGLWRESLARLHTVLTGRLIAHELIAALPAELG